MLTLLLLRHAKSSWDDAGLDDFDRPLSPRGLKAGPLMAAYLRAHALRPALVLCSTSVRTRMTLDLVMPAFEPVPAVMFEDALYLATATDLLARLKRVTRKPATVMMIGHNPGFHDLACRLAGGGETQALARLAAKFPTAGLAVLTFEQASWSDIGAKRGALTAFATPALLQSARASSGAAG